MFKYYFWIHVIHIAYVFKTLLPLTCFVDLFFLPFSYLAIYVLFGSYLTVLFIPKQKLIAAQTLYIKLNFNICLDNLH